jgi:hypothetical protein
MLTPTNPVHINLVYNWLKDKGWYYYAHPLSVLYAHMPWKVKFQLFGKSLAMRWDYFFRPPITWQ